LEDDAEAQAPQEDSMTDAREMPMTLYFEPENIDVPELGPDAKSVVIIQPSAVDGRIFMGINPFGKVVGVHVLAEDAARIRDHLNLMLWDQPEGTDEGAEEVASRINRAVERLQADKESEASKPLPIRMVRKAIKEFDSRRLERMLRRGRFFKFKIEFVFGRIQGVIARTDN
jgi:hypothetical protein